MKNGQGSRSKKSSAFDVSDRPLAGGGSLKDRLRLPRPKSHSVGDALIRDIGGRQSTAYHRQQQQAATANHAPLTVQTSTSLLLGGRGERMGEEGQTSLQLEGGRGGGGGGGGALRGAGRSNFEVVGVYTPPGVPTVD